MLFLLNLCLCISAFQTIPNLEIHIFGVSYVTNKRGYNKPTNVMRGVQQTNKCHAWPLKDFWNG